MSLQGMPLIQIVLDILLTNNDALISFNVQKECDHIDFAHGFIVG